MFYAKFLLIFDKITLKMSITDQGCIGFCGCFVTSYGEKQAKRENLVSSVPLRSVPRNPVIAYLWIGTRYFSEACSGYRPREEN